MKGKKKEKPILKIHSIDDVIKAGGADAYARKIGHIPLSKRTDIPDVGITDEELEAALALLREMRKG